MIDHTINAIILLNMYLHGGRRKTYMELRNYMEDLVLKKMDDVLAKYPDCCKCDHCRTDIAALALNNLPPKYISSHKGSIYARLDEMMVENATAIIEEIAKAIEIVSRHPRHDEVK